MPATTADVLTPADVSGRPQPTLQVDELTLRPWREDDADAVAAAYADPAIEQWHGRTVTAAEAPAWIAERRDGWASATMADWAVVDDDGLLGRVGVHGFLFRTGYAELAYWTVPRARGRRVAPRAADRMSRWWFDEVGMHRLALQHAAGNAASCHVAERAGFRFEGVLRAGELHADGWHDMHLHARLADDPPPDLA